LSAGDSFHGELARTRDALRGASPLHRSAERARKEERAEPERRADRAESRSAHARRTERPARRASQADESSGERAGAAREPRGDRGADAARIDAVESSPREPELAREACMEPGARPTDCGELGAGLDTAEPVDTRPIAAGEIRATPLPAAQRPNDRRASAETETVAPTGAGVTRPELDSPRRRVAWSAGERPGAERAEHRRAEEVLRQFRDLLHPTLRNATLNLEPRELGKLSIRISMHEGQLAANLRAERSETLELLKKHLPELRAALAAAGIQTQSLELELGAQERGNQPGAGAQRHAGAAHAGADASFEARLGRVRPVAPPRGQPGLDTWA
jgi:hypothetical protein